MSLALDRSDVLGARVVRPVPLSAPAFLAVGLAAMVATGVAVTLGPLPAVATTTATAGALAVLRRPELGGYTLVALVPVLSGVRRGLPVPGLRPSEALVVGLGGLLLLTSRRHQLAKWTGVDWALLIYAAVSALVPAAHLALRGGGLSLEALSPVLLPLQFFLLYRAVRTTIVTHGQRRVALRLLLGASVVVAAIATVQQLDIGPARRIVQEITNAEVLTSYGYTQNARATGPFQHWHPLAGYLTVMILLGVSLLLDARQRVMSRRGLVVVLVAATVGLMLSVTFTSMLGVLLGIAILGWRTQTLRRVLAGAAVAALAAAVVFGPVLLDRVERQYVEQSGVARTSLVPQTIGKRIEVWSKEYRPALAGRWLLGYGPDLPNGVRWTHTESLYITLLLRGGLVLLAAFSLSMIALGRAARRCTDVVPTERVSNLALAAAIAVLWPMHLLYPYLAGSGMAQPFYVLAALATMGKSSVFQGAMS